jgi:hypothetical protein
MFLTSPSARVAAAMRMVLPTPDARIEEVSHGDAEVVVASARLRARWVVRGWPREIRAAIGRPPQIDVVVAPRMSTGAQRVAREAGVGWVDETGAAEIVSPTLVVARGGAAAPTRPVVSRWTPSVAGVAEALLLGTPATQAAVARATGASTGTAASALRFLASEGLLVAAAARGRDAARRVADSVALLDAYAAAVASLRQRFEIRVGVIWRDPIADAARTCAAWTVEGRDWAATGALAAAALAPYQTEVAPLVIYVEAAAITQLRLAAQAAGLREIDGGRLLLRPFPSAVTARLSALTDSELRCAPWPRVYADLLRTGVRGEDAAEHLRERMMATADG